MATVLGPGDSGSMPPAPVARRAIGGIAPGLALFLIAPILGELISGHMTPWEFLNPISWLLMAMPYGLGALVCRELIVRWDKGWWSLMSLGVAYGLYEEGVVARSLYDPRWSEMGSLAEYNHVAGLNWTYTEVLLHFHTTVSILASVTLVQVIFPARRRESWIGPRAFWGCVTGLLLWTPAIMGVQLLIDDPDFPFFFPPLGYFVATLAAIAGCIILARRLPRPTAPPQTRLVRRPLAFGVLGAVNMLTVFVTVFAVPEWDSPPPLIASVLTVLALDAGTVWLISRWSGRLAAWDDRHVFALVAGQLSFFAAYGVLADIDEGFQGRTLVAVATALGLAWIRRRLPRRAGIAAAVGP